MMFKKTVIAGLFVLAVGCGANTQGSTQTASSAGCHQLGAESQGAVSMFYQPGNVYAAKRIEKTKFLARAIQRDQVVGANLYMHAQPGLTEQYLERALVCHAATGRATHPNDPLHPTQGAVKTISVDSAPAGLVIRVVGDGEQTGKEIWSRARAFAAPSGSTTVEQIASGGAVSPL